MDLYPFFRPSCRLAGSVAILVVATYLSSTAGGTWQVVLQDDSTRYGEPFFLNRDTGWIPFLSVGGTPPVRRGLLRTEDGGATWDTIPDTYKYSMERVFFADLQHGWSYAPGLGGGITRTTDGGRSWIDISEGFPYIEHQQDYFNPNAIWFHDSSLGWATGEYAVLLRTTDGGLSWDVVNMDSVTPGLWRHFDDIVFVDSLYGWAAGGNNARVLARTTDGGRTWEGDFMEYNLPVGNLVSLSFTDRKHGVVVDSYSEYSSFRTSDGGDTWDEIASFPGSGIVDHVTFVDSLSGWVCGSLGSEQEYTGFLYATTDGGATWSTSVFEILRGVGGITFPDRRTGYLTGGGGVLKYREESGVEEEKELVVEEEPDLR